MENFNDVKVYDGGDFAKNGVADMVRSGDTMMQQRTPYCTAVQVVKPRNLQEVKDKVLEEVKLEPEAAYYCWDVKDKNAPGGKKEVIGATIGLEMSIARNFGNCAIDINIQEMSDSFLFIPAFLDLESGFTFSRAFRQNRTQNLGKYDPERAQDMRFQIGQSKAIRNVIRNATPKALTNAAIELARELVRMKISHDGVEKTRAKVLSAFKSLGIEADRLAQYTGKADPSEWELDILERLITLGKAIKSGDISIEDAFPETIAPKVTGSPDAMKPADKKDAKKEAKHADGTLGLEG